MPSTPTDFVDGLVTLAGNGGAGRAGGLRHPHLCANRSMQGRFFYDADGELLIVPQQGVALATELGVLEVEPQEIAVIPRGVRFRVELLDGEARGYVAKTSAPAASAGSGSDRRQRPGECRAISSRRSPRTKMSKARSN
jgi:homogentisate 1,2-dioxygenase